MFRADLPLIISKYHCVHTATGICHVFMLTGCWQDRDGTDIYQLLYIQNSRGQLKCDGTRAETIFRLSCETDESILIGRGASVQSTVGS